jgi:hypothetical protein
MPPTLTEPPVPQLLLTPRAAAAALFVSERTLWGLTAPRGPIPAVRIGRAVRYDLEALRYYIAVQRGGPVMSPDPYLDRDGLLALDIDPADVDRLLRNTPLTGHDGRPVVEAERLPELLEMLRRERGGRQ